MRVKENRKISFIVPTHIFPPKDGFFPFWLYPEFDFSQAITAGWLSSHNFYSPFAFLNQHSLSGRSSVK